MTLASPPPARRAVLVLTVLGLAGCASLPNVDPADVPRLESAVRRSPGDAGLRAQLGMAQFKAGDFGAARTSLQAAVDGGEDNPAAYLYLGMAQEELLDWSAARDSYTTYMQVANSAQARNEVRQRLTLIGRNLLRTQAQQALAQEAEITSTRSVTPQSVAVLPMGFNSTNTDLEPLIYALADMMVTDFKVSNALTVLERSEIQTLLDEMSLTSAGYAEPGTGARAGRLLRAEHVVQGVLTTLGDDDLQTDTDVLDVLGQASAGAFTEEAALEQIFDMEKQIVIRTIREVLGLELTPAEEQRILDNRMNNVLAFLAHGRGLRELDLGNYESARTQFELALQLEGGNYAATELAMAETASLIEATSTTTDDISGIAGTTGETGVGLIGPPPASVGDASPLGIQPPSPVGTGTTTSGPTSFGALNTLRSISEGVAPTPTAGTLDLGSANQGQDAPTTTTNDTARDPVQEQNDESVSSTTDAQIRIVIRRPGGEQ